MARRQAPMTINPATAPRRLLLLLLTPLLLPIHWWSASAARSASSFFTPERTNRHHVHRRLVRSSSSVEDAAVKCASSIAIPSLRGGYDEGVLGGGGASNVRTMTSLAQIRAVIEDAASSSSSSSSDGGDDDQVLVVLDFASRNCPPCEMIKPVYDELSVSIEFVDRRVVFCAVNVSDHPDVAEYYGVDGWPTFLFFRGGVEVDRMVGGRAAKEGLYGLISKHSSR